MIKGLSLFSSAGIGETYLNEVGVNIIVANELIERRANLHNRLYPDSASLNHWNTDGVQRFTCLPVPTTISTASTPSGGLSRNGHHLPRIRRRHILPMSLPSPASCRMNPSASRQTSPRGG